MPWLSGCNLQQRSAQYSLVESTNTPDGPPRIQIRSPSNGDEFVVGEEILVSVSASDSIGVNRVQLFVDGQIVHTVSSESLQGDLSLEAILNYAPININVPETVQIQYIDPVTHLQHMTYYL